MWAELKALMTTQGWDVAATEQLWASDFAGRKIISGFMKDKELGEKRLASMPDRVTNTINTLGDAGKVQPNPNPNPNPNQGAPPHGHLPSL